MLYTLHVRPTIRVALSRVFFFVFNKTGLLKPLQCRRYEQLSPLNPPCHHSRGD